MIARLRALYRLYASAHMARARAFALPRWRGRRLGRVEVVRRAEGTLYLSGWTVARLVTLRGAGGRAEVAPHLARPDVAKQLGLDQAVGFELRVPDRGGAYVLGLTAPDGRVINLSLTNHLRRPGRMAVRRLRRMFVRDVLLAVGPIIDWMRDPTQARRDAVKRVFGLLLPPARPRLLPLMPRDRPAPRGQGPITIIVPVHNAFDAMAECLERVERNTDLPWHLIIVDDGSTDRRVRPFLQAMQKRMPDRVRLLTNAQSVGFVRSVNRALAHRPDPKQPVILLNSDAFVPPNWASRLIAPLQQEVRIASVTPLSNAAEILSVPAFGQAVTAGLGDQIDGVANDLTSETPWPESPTAVGFCMAISPEWLARVPQFDESFGRGYGEEVDWCQKVRRLGGRHVAHSGVFLTHLGAQSFGINEKAARQPRVNAEIARRYPGFDGDVQTWQATDPLHAVKMTLGLAQATADTTRPVPLFLAHSLGGGAELALMQEVAAETTHNRLALVLRVGGSDRWRLEVHWAGGVMSGGTDDLATVRAVLSAIPALHIIYSCGVGDRDPLTLPESLLSLRRPDHPDQVSARLHDYFMLSPSYCLLDAQAAFRGVGQTALGGPAHRVVRPDGTVIPLVEWQAAWLRFMSECTEIVTFSEASRRLLTQAHPSLASLAVLRPHRLAVPVPRLAKPKGRRPVVGILGNLNVQKGAGLICDMARRSGRPGDPSFVVIGNFDPGLVLPHSVTLHGGYERREIADLARYYGVTAWLSPSIWPETFSFTTHEMLATGLPVIGFDLGGQGEALRAAPNGHVVGFDPDADLAGALLGQVRAVTKTRVARGALTPALRPAIGR